METIANITAAGAGLSAGKDLLNKGFEKFSKDYWKIKKADKKKEQQLSAKTKHEKLEEAVQFLADEQAGVFNKFGDRMDAVSVYNKEIESMSAKKDARDKKEEMEKFNQAKSAGKINEFGENSDDAEEKETIQKETIQDAIDKPFEDDVELKNTLRTNTSIAEETNTTLNGNNEILDRIEQNTRTTADASKDEAAARKKTAIGDRESKRDAMFSRFGKEKSMKSGGGFMKWLRGSFLFKVFKTIGTLFKTSVGKVIGIIALVTPVLIEFKDSIISAAIAVKDFVADLWQTIKDLWDKISGWWSGTQEEQNQKKVVEEAKSSGITIDDAGRNSFDAEVAAKEFKAGNITIKQLEQLRDSGNLSDDDDGIGAINKFLAGLKKTQDQSSNNDSSDKRDPIQQKNEASLQVTSTPAVISPKDAILSVEKEKKMDALIKQNNPNHLVPIQKQDKSTKILESKILDSNKILESKIDTKATIQESNNPFTKWGKMMEGMSPDEQLKSVKDYQSLYGIDSKEEHPWDALFGIDNPLMGKDFMGADGQLTDSYGKFLDTVDTLSNNLEKWSGNADDKSKEQNPLFKFKGRLESPPFKVLEPNDSNNNKNTQPVIINNNTNTTTTKSSNAIIQASTVHASNIPNGMESSW